MKAGEAGCGEAQGLPDTQFSTSHEAPGLKTDPHCSTELHAGNGGRAACWEERYCSSLAANTEGLPDSVSSKSTLSRW